MSFEPAPPKMVEYAETIVGFQKQYGEDRFRFVADLVELHGSTLNLFQQVEAVGCILFLWQQCGNETLTRVVESLRGMQPPAPIPSMPPAPDSDLVAKLAGSVDTLTLPKNLQRRVRDCLVNAAISHLVDLVQKTEEEMIQTKNFGRKSFGAVKGALRSMGLSLGMQLNEATLTAVREEIARREAGR